MTGDLVELQRRIDGYSSSDSEQDAPAAASSSHAATDKDEPEQEAGRSDPDGRINPDSEKSDTDEDEVFDLAAVVAEGRQRRLERRKEARKAEEDAKNGISPGVKLPCPAREMELMAERVREEAAQRELHARRSRQRPEELTHVSAGGDTSQGLSRRERRRQKIENATKKPQQVYVGLPIGKSWHVPLVGIEGRGGYRKAAEEEEETEKAGEKRKASLTVKEREKLKRKKGQSSHATWKPELWMQLRQQFD
ncbi:hypothetical protein NCLIV_044070 [Neospora caninum Liverpool]|uniref:Uncharacterized protein n=1 Tax=Neospora caninum (strain Liverpool) TaxID=572307 RepID=F0VAT4_NEOCL|nr:hypothetical protein NCLIV_044070 [Neospora caninum Liverpool]CBZ51342.1 hypothetical protein NCLIV_044070 [Neospora caninum Liverpool]CEL68659.1 TPA: hypothetical protein BN1204_044070 [Neospora caninum Liverpool]|eukprot:XP_003881375.1 hypothetical protein NCLIV_044070 [Neospora caninum Liverpool]